MGKIEINDLPEDQKISKEEMRKVFGGTLRLTRSASMISSMWNRIREIESSIIDNLR